MPLLHIDDNPDDRLLIEEAIRATNTPFEFHGVAGLQAAVDYFLQSAIENFPLARQPDCPPDHPRPALILLDYDLGGRCGTDFLNRLMLASKSHRVVPESSGRKVFPENNLALTADKALVSDRLLCWREQRFRDGVGRVETGPSEAKA